MTPQSQFEPADRPDLAAPGLSRAGFLRGGALAVAGAGALGAAGTALAPPAEAKGVDPNPEYRRARVTRLATLTGPGITTRFRMEATDLGIPAVTPDGRILMVFGDTFEGAKVGAGFWRSPVALYADAKKSLNAGLRWTGAVGGETAQQLVDYSHEGPVSTILPGDVITVGDVMYLWMMVNEGFGNVTSTEIWTSRDSGESWERTATMFPGDHLGGQMQQITWALHPEDGHVYVLSTGFQRDKGVICSRVPADRLLDPSAYETWGGEKGAESFGSEAEPTEVIGGRIGEMCWRVVEGRWVFTCFDAGLYRIDVRVLEGPTAFDGAPHDTVLWGCDWGREDDERVAQLYGGYILPGSRLDDLHLAVSQWHTGPDWPYHVQQFRIQGLGAALT